MGYICLLELLVVFLQWFSSATVSWLFIMPLQELWPWDDAQWPCGTGRVLPGPDIHCSAEAASCCLETTSSPFQSITSNLLRFLSTEFCRTSVLVWNFQIHFSFVQCIKKTWTVYSITAVSWSISLSSPKPVKCIEIATVVMFSKFTSSQWRKGSICRGMCAAALTGVY